MKANSSWRRREGRPAVGKPGRLLVLTTKEWEEEFFPLLADHLVAEVNQECPAKVITNKRAAVAHQKLGLWYERVTGVKPGASHKSVTEANGLARSFKVGGPYIRTLQKLFDKLGIGRQAFSYIQKSYGNHDPDPAGTMVEMVRFRRSLGPWTMAREQLLRSQIAHALSLVETDDTPPS
jgi:hypothetical protein